MLASRWVRKKTENAAALFASLSVVVIRPSSSLRSVWRVKRGKDKNAGSIFFFFYLPPRARYWCARGPIAGSACVVTAARRFHRLPWLTHVCLRGQNHNQEPTTKNPPRTRPEASKTVLEIHFFFFFFFKLFLFLTFTLTTPTDKNERLDVVGMVEALTIDYPDPIFIVHYSEI